MKGHPTSYLDEEKLLQEEEVIRIKLLQPISRSPYPLHDNPEQAIPRGTILSLPLWLATPLINASIAVPVLPKAYTPTSRQAILASARNVNIPNLGRKHFYGLGAKRATQWWPALQLNELLYDTFRGRLELMYAHPVGAMSSNTRSYTNTTENITDRLDSEEMQVYKSCTEQRRLFECWSNMGVVRKITRRPIPLGVVTSDNDDDDSKSKVSMEKVENKKVENFDDTKLAEEEILTPPESPLNVHWEGLVTTISSIGNTLASKANKTIDHIYEIANASSPLELDNSQKKRNTSIDYANDLEDLKNKLKIQQAPSEVKTYIINTEEAQSEVITVKPETTAEKSPVKGIQGKKNTKKKNVAAPTAIHKELEGKKVETKKDESSKEMKEMAERIGEQVSKTPNDAQVVKNVAAALGSFSKSVISKARESLYATQAVNYSATEDISLNDLFTRFGGQAALTRLQISSSEAAQAYKKHLRTLKPSESKALTQKAKEIDSLFEPEHLLESVVLLEESLGKNFEAEEISECLEREKQESAVYARHHFSHLTALACQTINLQKPTEATFQHITSIISELQLLLSQYEQLITENSSILLEDANECIKLLTEAAYQLVPIYKHALITNKD